MKTLHTPAALAEAGLIPVARIAELEPVAARYAVAITPAVAELIQHSADPIALQYLPQVAELETSPGETADPIGDDVHSPIEGVVHRYPDRILLKLTHVCATYCRFCFRREMVGPAGVKALGARAVDQALAYIAQRPDIWEVILTGGDPLVLSARRLRAVMARLAAIEHVKVVRFHTRVPAVSPAAITPELIAAMRCEGKAVWVALHVNHARELTPAVREACGRIVDAGLPMVSQSVLLKGVNDNPAALAELMRAFVETRIKPYYLHHLDAANGVGHFRTSIAEGQTLMRSLRGKISGLCQPAYVLDIPGGHGKVPIGPEYLEADAVRDPRGHRHSL